MAYVTGGSKPTSDLDTPLGCPFCHAPTKPADEGLVVARGRTVFAVLNLYPYNPGHLMVCPYRHVADYTDLDEAETLELAQFTQTAMRVIRRVSAPQGFNLGVNQGHVAGAGIAAHLHQHVVPRWAGDTNFMPIVARTKTLPQLLEDTRHLLASEWEARGEAVGTTAPKKVTRAKRAAASVQAATPAEAASGKTASAKAASAKAASAKAAKPVAPARSPLSRVPRSAKA
jgi:ATP adenylyltransferase